MNETSSHLQHKSISNITQMLTGIDNYGKTHTRRIKVWANISAFRQNQQVSDVSFNTVGQYDNSSPEPQ